MKVIFSKLAKQELDDGAEYYELEHPGLGRSFKREVKTSISRIKKYPFAWSIEHGEVRKCLLHKFPYKVLYSVEKDHIFIIAVAHQHRKPSYWLDQEER